MDTAPKWAYDFVPSIPFIGNEYKPGEGLLVYASAENFTWMNRRDIPARYGDGRAWNRYRAAYEDEERGSTSFFPTIGIKPFNDGGLPTAALFVAMRVGCKVKVLPRELLETLCVSNWAKFTCKAEKNRNRDYVGNPAMLGHSLQFVLLELLALQPSVVILPDKVWKVDVFSSAMQGVCPSCVFLPSPQFNARVVNCHLTTYAERAEAIRRETQGSLLAEWMGHLRGLNSGHAWRYIAKLDDTITRRAFGLRGAP
jgi:hypothetical protein